MAESAEKQWQKKEFEVKTHVKILTCSTPMIAKLAEIPWT